MLLLYCLDQFKKALLLMIGLLLNSYYFLIYFENPEVEQYIRAGLIIVSGAFLVYQRLYVSSGKKYRPLSVYCIGFWTTFRRLNRPLSPVGPYTFIQDHPLKPRPMYLFQERKIN